MTAEELQATARELSDQCIADIEENWTFSPSARLAMVARKSPIPAAVLDQMDWRNTVRYHMKRIVFQKLDQERKGDA